MERRTLLQIEAIPSQHLHPGHHEFLLRTVLRAHFIAGNSEKITAFPIPFAAVHTHPESAVVVPSFV
jgi:hypothetical protein